jgi:hypothetical protein
MEVKIVNEDILDEKEPTIYVQRYYYPHRTYQVFRKPTSNDEPFVISEDAEQMLWCISTFLINPEPYNPDDYDGLPEIFAMIYLDEENPPVDDPEDCHGAEPYINLVYDPETQLYGCEATSIEYEEVDTISALTLQEVIDQALAMLDEFFEKKAIQP